MALAHGTKGLPALGSLLLPDVDVVPVERRPATVEEIQGSVKIMRALYGGRLILGDWRKN